MTAKNIHEAILAVMAEVGYVQKESAPALKYTFASEAALIRALRPVMVKHGVYCYVLDLPSLTQEAFTTKHDTLMNRTTTHGVVRFVHALSETFIDAHASGEAMDAGDKSANKAATGLLKYALRQTFLIETGDDPDETPSEEQERPTARPEPVATRPLEPAALKEMLAKKAAQHHKKGRTMSPQQLGLMSAMLQKCFDDLEDPASAGVLVVHYLFGVPLPLELGDAEVLATLDWLGPTKDKDGNGAYSPSMDARIEARRVFDLAASEDKEQG